MSSRENLELVQDVMQQMCAQFDAESTRTENIIHSIAAQKRDIAGLTAKKNAKLKACIQGSSVCLFGLSYRPFPDYSISSLPTIPSTELQACVAKLRKHASNPALKSLETKQELVRRDIADVQRSIDAADSDIAESIATLDRLRAGISQLSESKAELHAHVREQMQVAEEHVHLYTSLTSIAFDSAPGASAGTAATALAAGSNGVVGRAIALPGVPASAGSDPSEDVVSGAIHMFYAGDIRPFAFAPGRVASCEVANRLWDAMWEEQCAKRANAAAAE